MRNAKLGKKFGKHSKEWNYHISKGHNIPIICIETGEIYESTLIAAKKTGINRSAIANCLSGFSKTAGGFH